MFNLLQEYLLITEPLLTSVITYYPSKVLPPLTNLVRANLKVGNYLQGIRDQHEHGSQTKNIYPATYNRSWCMKLDLWRFLSLDFRGAVTNTSAELEMKYNGNNTENLDTWTLLVLPAMQPWESH